MIPLSNVAQEKRLETVPPRPEALPLAIEARGLVKSYGKRDALGGLDLRVPRSSTYALLGRNGAGKSTLIQILTGMLEPTEGEVSVLGLSPQKDGVALKQKLGYIPDFLPMYDWMKVGELLRFTASFYAGWSWEEEARLVQKFGLDMGQKVGALSRGNRALLTLVIAVAHQPELVLLDEATSGMDAIARREFERSVIDTLQSSGRTILFAGHQIDEMERICDWVGVMKSGKLLLEMPLDTLKSSVQAARIRLSGAGEGAVPVIEGASVLQARRLGRDLLLTARLDQPDRSLPELLPPGTQFVETIPLSLEEIFVVLLGPEEGAR